VLAFIFAQVERQFNTLLDACGSFRNDIGGAADVVSLGRAMEQLSSGALALTALLVLCERTLLLH
jgi:hypothetical protein